MNWETLRCYGDSITFGARTYLGYPEYCSQTLQAKTEKLWNTQNIAVSGYTVLDLLRHIDQHPLFVSKHNCPEVVTVLIGTNDHI